MPAGLYVFYIFYGKEYLENQRPKVIHNETNITKIEATIESASGTLDSILEKKANTLLRELPKDTPYSTGSVFCGYLITKTGGYGYEWINLISSERFFIETNAIIRYITKGNSRDMISIHTNTGSFLYNIHTTQSIPIPLYDQVSVTRGWHLIGLIRESSREKKSLLSLSDTTGDIVLFENNTNRQVLFEGNNTIELLCEVDGNIEIIMSDGEKKRISYTE